MSSRSRSSSCSNIIMYNLCKPFQSVIKDLVYQPTLTKPFITFISGIHTLYKWLYWGYNSIITDLYIDTFFLVSQPSCLPALRPCSVRLRPFAMPPCRRLSGRRAIWSGLRPSLGVARGQGSSTLADRPWTRSGWKTIQTSR